MANAFDDSDEVYDSSEEGKVDQGGSIAQTLARFTRIHVEATGGLSGDARAQVTRVAKALVSAARELGLVGDFDFLNARRNDTEGQEHDVWFDLQSDPQLAWKATKVGKYGLAPGKDGPTTALDYLERVELANMVFGVPWEVHGVWMDRFDRPRIVSVQAYLDGEPANEEQIFHFFEQFGFERADGSLGEPLWIHHGLGVVAGDAYGDNFVVLRDTGELIPFDVPLAWLR